MDSEVPHQETANDPRALQRALSAYRAPRLARSVFEALVTVIPFGLFWFLTWASVSAGYWIGLLLVIPAAGFLVRLFMIQHDCGHGSFFPSRRANDWLGRALGVLTLTPYDLWRHTHALHHAHSGNLDRADEGSIDTLSVREYQALPQAQRLRYRLYRHPLILFGLGPVYQFMLQNRVPVGFMRSGWMPWLSTMGTNAAIVLVIIAMMSLVGAETFLLVHLPIAVLASSIGVWLFYVQHQFDNTRWEHDEEWSFRDVALYGSSYYDLPAPLRWITANIGVHHVHHLASRIPFYRLPEVLTDFPQLREVSRLTLKQSLECTRLALWDEERRRLVPFKHANAETPPVRA
ncbi:fatty acid desaturase [Franzmannia qiaohouensis]|uniref:Fatty acid desaturase n=1 Tax=Franzmannia qiaohouensis TaxID=1329370 RepID=A0ABU1HD01_9GAMM|nr:fatty acid desaturase [Halomonas qiaohouensis]MDR5905345.1 fatty acid desaturase [Halomonas qiaohouensis]